MVRLEELTIIRAPIERCFDLARSIDVHIAGAAKSQETAVGKEGISGLMDLGQRVTWRAKHLGFMQELTSEITAMNRPTYFQDRMIRGVFRWMEHDHFFRPISPGETAMTDVFWFAAPFGILGRLAEVVVLRRHMQAFLKKRNAALRSIAESAEWRNYLRSTLASTTALPPRTNFLE
jgi:ligand-binding SRPBCC domain-containing protein